ncbi:hypothetical protein B6D60_10220 [candidate division KSB1 bacterium 4484_87]|nr:MAG: hypothetical protein B6D60_10220 [candidate division KSB1 bacterium 4484_87]
MDKTRAARNRTITLSQPEREYYREELLRISKPVATNTIENKMVNNDIFEILDFLPSGVGVGLR